MTINFESEGKAPEMIMEMNLTPLIDVMLVLLIMFISTFPNQNHAVILGWSGCRLPFTNDIQPEVVTIDIDFDGSVLWNGNAMSTRQNWESKFQIIGALPPEAQPEIHLRPNMLAEYKTVVSVLASAQRMGLTNIGIIMNDQIL